MKILTLILILSASIANAQNIEKEVNSISKFYNSIETSLRNFTQKQVSADDFSAEGGEAVGYLDNDSIQKINVSLYGESGKSFYAFYYRDHNLIFVLFTRHQYNAPFYFDKKMAKENGVATFFDENKTEILEYRYYLKDDKIIRCIGPDHKIIPIPSENVESEKTYFMDLSNDVKKRIEQY